MANKNLVLVAVSLLALFAIAAVPADAFVLNFTVALQNGTLIGANITMATWWDRNPETAFSNKTQSDQNGRANLVVSDDNTYVWNFIVLYNHTFYNRFSLGGVYSHVSLPLPPLPKTAFLALMTNTTTIKVAPALNIFMIAFNDTAISINHILPNGSFMANYSQLFNTSTRFGSGNISFNNSIQNRTNASAFTAATAFSYIIFDRDKGIPIEYSTPRENRSRIDFLQNTTPYGDLKEGQIAQAVVPLERNYTVLMYSRSGESPPRYVDIINPATNTSLNLTPIVGSNTDNISYAVGIAMNFTTSYVNVSGYIAVPQYASNGSGSNAGNHPGIGGNYITITNITAIPYVNEYAFVAAHQRGVSPYTGAVSTGIFRVLQVPESNITLAGKNMSLWVYNISLPTQTSWILIASGVNITSRNSSYVVGMTNVTIGTTALTGVNFTVRSVYNSSTPGGSYTGNGTNMLPVNMTMTQLQLLDGDTNGTILGNSYIIIELNVNNSVTATNLLPTRIIKIKFAMETSASGRVGFPFFVNETVKVAAYTGRHAPMEFVLGPDQLSANETLNLTLHMYRPRIPGRPGGVVGNNIPDKFMQNLEISILGNNDTCNRVSVNIPAGCVLSQVNQPQDVNPLAGLFQGQKVSVRIRDLYNGHIVHYYGVDVSGGGVPEAQFDPAAEDRSGAAADYVFKVGARLPKNTYEGIFVGLQYDSGKVDESSEMNASIATLYDTNWNPVWNVTQNGTPFTASAAFNTTDFTDWNLSLIANRSLGGVICSKTNGGPGFACLANTTEDKIWLRLPHFSGSGIGVVGVKVASTETASSGTSGGGGAGGGGGGAVGGTSQSFVSTTVTAQAPVSNDVTKSEIGLTQVEYTLTENANNVKLEVNKLADKPADIPSSPPAGTAYSYVSITISGVDSSKVSSGKVKFTVDKSWVTDNNADVNSVKLNRWDGTAWSALSTSYTGETDTAYTYEATTPGFSTFAITATTRTGAAAPSTSAGGAPEAAAPTTTGKPGTTVPVTTTGGNTTLWVIVAVIVIAVVIGLVMKGRGKKKWY